MANARDNARAKFSALELEAAQRLAAHCTSTSNYVACLDSSRSVMVAASDPAPSEAAFVKAMQAHQQQAQAQTSARSGNPQMIGNGTGFFVSPDGDLVTAAHVANECPDMRIMDKHLKLVAKDTASDLALLSTGEKSPAFVKMRGGRGPVLGEDGALLGVARSSISTLQAAQDIGGAVPQNANFAVSASTLQSFLSAHSVDYVLTTGSEPKKNSAEIASQASRFTVMVECWK